MAGGFSLRQNAQSMKNHATAVLGEILGTAMFLFIAEGAAKTAHLSRVNIIKAGGNNALDPLDPQTIMMLATAFGLSLLVTAWMFYRITGALFNPAITVALWLIGVLTTVRAILLFAAQLVGGIIASALVLALIPDGVGGMVGVRTTLSAQTSVAQGVILEFLGTSLLVFSVLMLAVEKHRATFLAPVGIGLTLFALMIFITSWTGCSLNPARSLGPSVVSGVFHSYHWIYWVGPLCGGMLSVVYFQLLKSMNYNSVVMDQDTDREVSGLRPIYIQAFKKLKGDRNWRRSETQRKKKRHLMLVWRHRKVVQSDGSPAVLDTPVMIDIEQGRPDDEVLVQPAQMSEMRSDETLVERYGREEGQAMPPGTATTVTSSRSHGSLFGQMQDEDERRGTLPKGQQ